MSARPYSGETGLKGPVFFWKKQAEVNRDRLCRDCPETRYFILIPAEKAEV
jgi:hypothetical protein